MKTKLLLTLALVLGLSAVHQGQTAAITAAGKKYPYVEVVVTQERIWLMTDEKPVAGLPVQVLDEAGELVMQKSFCSKIAEWALDVSELPSGKYKILIGANQTEYLEKKGKKWSL